MKDQIKQDIKLLKAANKRDLKAIKEREKVIKSLEKKLK